MPLVYLDIKQKLAPNYKKKQQYLVKLCNAM